MNKYLEALIREQAQYSLATRSEIRQMKADITTAIHEAHARQGRYDSIASPDSVALSTIQESLLKLVKATHVVSQEDAILQRLWFAELGSRERTVEMPHKQTFQWLLYGSEPAVSNFQESAGGNQTIERVATSTSSFDRYSYFDHSPGSDDDDAMSFRTAPDGEEEGLPDCLTDLGPDEMPSDHQDNAAFGALNRFKRSRGMWHEEKERRKQKRQSFLNWLRTGDGIFYCSGKAGSGKSTVMKFLAQDRRTRDELSLWSRTQGKTLVLASFFFWSSGTPLQRSLEGLYREILWAVTRQCPSLLRVVFPAAWSSTGIGKPPESQQPFTMGELASAMDRLFREEDVTSSYRLCLFVDGLDEYEGDHWKFAKAMSRWAASSKDIKFCLSSRPHETFLQNLAMNEATHLRLHEITKADMYRFVSDQFRQDERYTAIEEDIRQELDLISAIVGRSDGVFLWVRLVTFELLKGMGEHCSIRQLIKRLDSIPDGLENMFRKMLNSIDKTEQQRAAEMVLTMTMPHEDLGELAFGQMVFIQAILDDLADDPGLAEMLLSGDVGPHLGTADCVNKCHNAGLRAVARCRGLIEVTHTGMTFPYCHRLSFVHRTVGDFLCDAGVQSGLESATGDPSNCLHRKLSQAALACFKFINPDQHLECPSYEPHRRPYHTSVRSTSDPGTTKADPFHIVPSFLRTIRNAELYGSSPVATEAYAMISMLQQISERHQNGNPVCQFYWPSHQLSVPSKSTRSGSISTHNLPSAVISYGISWYGLIETAIDLASKHRDLLVLSPGKSLIFLSSALEDLYDAYFLRGNISRTQSLIKQASSSINSDCSERLKISLKREVSADKRSLGLQFTVWTAFLLALSELIRVCHARAPSNFSRVCTLLDLFLQHGADPHVIFIGYSFATSTEDMKPTPPQGPFYMDLLDMMLFWRLPPTESTQNMLKLAREKQQQSWFRRSMAQFPWMSRRAEDLYAKMTPFNDRFGHGFVPLSIIPYNNLTSLSWEALQGAMDLISEHGIRQLCITIET